MSDEMTTPASVKGRLAVIHGTAEDGFQIHCAGRHSLLLNDEGNWESYRGQNKKWKTRAEAEAFLLSKSDAGDEREQGQGGERGDDGFPPRDTYSDEAWKQSVEGRIQALERPPRMPIKSESRCIECGGKGFVCEINDDGMAEQLPCSTCRPQVPSPPDAVVGELLATIRKKLEAIVETEGCDKGVIYLSNESKTHWDEARQCYVYEHENFSPLGDALIELHDLLLKAAAPAPAEMDELRQEVLRACLRDVHHVHCNYRNGPLGGYGCICVVVTQRSLDDAESALTAANAELARVTAALQKIEGGHFDTPEDDLEAALVAHQQCARAALSKGAADGKA